MISEHRAKNIWEIIFRSILLLVLLCLGVISATSYTSVGAFEESQQIVQSAVVQSKNLSQNTWVRSVLNLFPSDFGLQLRDPKSILTIGEDHTAEQWYLDRTEVRHAWQITTGSSDVIVAILDDGVDYTHEDLAENMIPGFDFIDFDNDPMPESSEEWHGTAVAGVIGAVHGNGGIDGVNAHVSMLPIRVCTAECVPNAIIDGINYAVIRQAKIINLSFGGDVYNSEIEDAILQAVQAGVLVVTIAGNDNQPYVYFPGSSPLTFAVGATDQSDLRWQDNGNEGSNFGEELDIMAPGPTDGFWTTYPNNSYSEVFGHTSGAAPQVSGLAALLFAANPTLTAGQVRAYIEVYADKVGGYNYVNGWNEEMGYGRINAYASLLAAAPLTFPNLSSPGNGMSGVPLRPTFYWNTIPTATSYEIQISTSPAFSSYISGVPSSANFTPSGDLSPLTTYYWRVRAWRGFESSNWSSVWSFSTSSVGGTPDTTPPSGNFTSPTNGSTIYDHTVTISVAAYDNSGGSGVHEVRFNAKWNNEWHGIYIDTTPPYSINWNMCTSGVPDGDVELGMQVWDNAGNVYNYSEHYPNPHITKIFNCSPPPTSEGVYLYEGSSYSGNYCYISQDAPSVGNACGSYWNDRARSIYIVGPYSAVLFQDDNYIGYNTVYNGSDPDLANETIGYQTSSIRIRRRVPAYFTLYDLGDWNGEPFASDRTVFNLAHWNFNDKAESIAIMPGYQVILCQHDNFHGFCGRADHDHSDINAIFQGLRNEVSSVRVCAGTCPSVPSNPTLLIPSNNILIPPDNPITLQWGGNGIQYMVEYWGGDLSNPVVHGWFNGTLWNIGTLPESINPYFWHVKAWNDYGEGGWSTDQQFYVRRPPLIGDTDDDGDVDIFDYSYLITYFGTSGPPGWIPADLDIDGDVDIFDYNLLLTHFGNSNNSGLNYQLPESPDEAPNPPTNVQFTFNNNGPKTFTFVNLDWDDASDNEEGFVFTWNAELLGGSNMDVPPYPSGIELRQDATNAELIYFPCDAENVHYFAGTIQSFNADGMSEPVPVLGSVISPECRIVGLEAISNAPISLNTQATLTAIVTAGSDITYQWDFGDGAYGSGSVVTHTYDTIGQFTALVTTTNSINVLTDTVSILVVDEQPIIGLWASHNGTQIVGNSSILTATVITGDNISYTWNLGDGTITTGEIVTHTFDQIGVYQVVVTATNLVSSKSATTLVYVDEEITNLNLNSIDSMMIEQSVEYSATISTGRNVLYIWDFGDGTFATGPIVYHTYSAPGTYTVTVRASNSVSAVVLSKTVLVKQNIYLPITIHE